MRISGQSLTKRNSHNSRTSDDIDRKLWPLTKLGKRSKTTSKKIDDGVMSENCDVIAIFRIYRRIGAIWKPDSRRRVCKTYLINTVLTLLLWVKVLFWPKKALIFCKINADISKIKMRALALKGIFSETTFGVLDQVLGGGG